MHRKKALFRYLGLSLVSLTLLTTMVLARRNLSSVQNLFGQASYTPANIYVDTAGTVGMLTWPWRSLAQGGEAKDYQFTPITAKLNALQPELIRLDHIYDFYDIVSKNAEGNLSFNWAAFDQILLQITGVGATPFISLSYMPPALSQGDITGRPDSWVEYQAVIKTTIEHVSGRNGLNLPGVYYEVWNEPDLFGGWKTYGDKNYLTLYDYASRGAQSVRNTNPFFFGGPGTTALYDNWTNKFFETAQAQNFRVDFFSWHNYDREVESYAKDVVHFYDLVRQYPRYLSAEPIISEWGHNSEIDVGYDTSLSAAHTVSVVSQLIPTIKHAFIFEIQDGKDPGGKEYWGRWGLLTHQDFGSRPKPRYQALLLLNKLGSNRLSLVGEGSYVKGLASQSDNGVAQVILANYDPASRHTETVPINFLNLKPGNYRLTTEFLGRLPTSTLLSVSASSLIHNVSMPINSVVLLELSRQ